VDVEALRELNLPAGAAAVEISMSALPELEVALAVAPAEADANPASHERGFAMPTVDQGDTPSPHAP
jgi:hypothetical protein